MKNFRRRSSHRSRRGRSTSHLSSSNSNQRRLRVETLEDRRLLAITVDTLTDELDGSIADGDISLRDAIAAATAGETIDFAVGGTVNLNNALGELSVDKSLSIDGGNRITLDAGGNSRVLRFSGSGTNSFQLNNLTIANGDSFDGGGIHLSGADNSLDIDRVAFLNNNSNDGGALSVSAASATISNSSFIDNTTTFVGSAVALRGADVRLINVTASGNSGGPTIRNLALTGQKSTLRILSSTLAENSGNAAVETGIEGSGIAETIIGSSIIADNSSNNFGFFGTGATVTSQGYNISDDTTGSLTATGDQQNTDPLLAPLADNGGPTQTHALLPGSPAIDAGQPLIPELDPRTDQRGQPFLRVGTPDIGSFELQTVNPGVFVVTTGADEVDYNLFTGAEVSLREAILAANAVPGPNTITFDPSLSGETIQLTLGELYASDSLTIDASALTHNVVVDAQQQSRVLNFEGSSSDLSIHNLTLQNGRTTGDDPTGSTLDFRPFSGGGIRFISEGDLNLTDTTIHNNAVEGLGARGGGVFAYGATTTLTRTTIDGNSAVDGQGGGLFVARDFFNQIGPTLVQDSTISGNTSGNRGGGINAYDGLLTMVRSTINDNQSEDRGGGIFARSGLDLTNSTVSGNRTTGALGDGGGIAGSGVLDVNSSTIYRNTANHVDSRGGGIYAHAGTFSSVNISNSIVAGNRARNTSFDFGQGPDIFVLAANPSNLTSVEFSIIGDTTDSSIATTTGTGNFLNTDPLLEPLGDNGGPTKTHATQFNSPAINNGDDAVAEATDQRGFPFHRDGGNGTDIGSYERQTLTQLTFVVDTAIDENDGDYSAGDLSLREAIGLANGSISGGDTIAFGSLFDTPQTIELSEQLPTIIDGVAITGPGALFLTIDAGDGADNQFGTGDGFRVFNIDINNPFVTDVSVSGVTITGGDGPDGAGILLRSGNLSLTESEISGNSSSFGGGGVFFSINTSLEIERSTVSDNNAAGFGGGIIGDGTLSVLGSTISGNAAGRQGGGAWFNFRSGGSGTIVNSTISGNRANSLGSGEGGGGIRHLNGPLTIRSSTITDNNSNANGGGIVSGSGVLNIQNSIVAGNTAPTNANVDGTIVNNLFNFIGGDPMLLPLAFRGGLTQTHAPAPNSSILENGDDSVPETSDQRGLPFQRNAGAGVDIGAYENQEVGSLNLVVDTTLDENDGDYSAGDLSLREAIGLANGAASSVGHTITFSSLFDTPQEIKLAAELPRIVADLTITGPGADLLTIDAGHGADNQPNTQDGFRLLNINDRVDNTVVDVTVSGVTLTGGDTTGGGGAIENSESLQLIDSVVTGNSAGTGGGIYNGGELVLTRSAISGNRAGSGGGITSFGSLNGETTTLAIDSSTLSNNEARGDGGALTIDTINYLTIKDSTVSGNKSGGSGGGLATRASTAFITGSTFSDNEAGYEVPYGDGGAIWSNDKLMGQVLTIANSTLTGNSAKRGGALFSFNGHSNIQSSTIYQNSTQAGGAIRHIQGSTTSLTSTIVANGTMGGDLDGSFSGSFNLIEDGSSLSSFTNSIMGAPLLGPLADNGGPTQTHALLPGSPAIDAGGATILVAPISVTSSTAASDTFDADSLIDGSGLTSLSLGNIANATHEIAANANAWVTTSEGSVDGDYFAGSNPNPTLTFNFSESVLLTDLVVWGYSFGSTNNNEAKELELSFSTDGGTTFGQTINISHNLTALNSETISFGTAVEANAVHLVITDNHFDGTPGNGGDRVGLGEIRFLAVEAFDQRGIARNVNGIDIGAYEAQVKPSADFDSDGDVDGVDFLAWQVGFGKANTQRADGNSDDDTDVDASDLAAWQVSYGTTTVVTTLIDATTGNGQFALDNVGDATSIGSGSEPLNVDLNRDRAFRAIGNTSGRGLSISGWEITRDTYTSNNSTLGVDGNYGFAPSAGTGPGETGQLFVNSGSITAKSSPIAYSFSAGDLINLRYFLGSDTNGATETAFADATLIFDAGLTTEFTHSFAQASGTGTTVGPNTQQEEHYVLTENASTLTLLFLLEGGNDTPGIRGLIDDVALSVSRLQLPASSQLAASTEGSGQTLAAMMIAPQVAPSTSPTVNTDFIDAAIALEWLGHEVEEESAATAERSISEAAFALELPSQELLPTVGSHLESEMKDLIVNEESKANDQAWLSDGLLELLFG